MPKKRSYEPKSRSDKITEIGRTVFKQFDTIEDTTELFDVLGGVVGSIIAAAINSSQLQGEEQLVSIFNAMNEVIVSSENTITDLTGVYLGSEEELENRIIH